MCSLFIPFEKSLQSVKHVFRKTQTCTIMIADEAFGDNPLSALEGLLSTNKPPSGNELQAVDKALAPLITELATVAQTMERLRDELQV